MTPKKIPFSYNINRMCAVDLVSIIHIDDYDTRFIELHLTDEGEPFAVDGSTVTARFVTVREKYLLSDNVPCEADGNTITIPIDEAAVQSMSCDIKIEVNIVNGEKILTLPFPLWIRVRGSILQDAEITPESKGTIPELLEEVKEELERVQGYVDEEQVKDIIDGVLSGVTTNIPTLLIDNTVNQQYNPDGHLLWYYIDSDGTRHNLFDFTPYIGGTDNYNFLKNKPSINGVALSGNKLAADLGLQETLSQGNINEIVAAASNGTMKRSGYRVTTNEAVIVDRASADGFIANARATAKAINLKAIQSATVNDDGTITFTLADGSTITTTGESVIGADGASITYVEIRSGDLYVTISDETTAQIINVGRVRGENGVNGLNGAGYVAAEINSDGELVLTYQTAYRPGDDPAETQVNLGRVVGAQGVPGDDYVLTAADKTEIAAEAAGMIDISGKADKADTYTKSEVDAAIQTAIGSIETQLSQV